MLTFYRCFGRLLYPYRNILLLGALVTGLSFIALIFADAEQGTYLLPLLVTTLLFSCLLLTVQLFSQPSPVIVSRWRRWLTWLVHWLMALLLTAILLVWFVLFLKSLSAIIRHLLF